MPVDANITSSAEWFVGEDKVLTVTVRDANNAAVNITGWELEWILRTSRYHPTAKVTKATGGQGIIILTQSGPTLGQFTVQVDRADTQGLKAGTYWHGAARTNTNNFDVVAEGSAVLRKAAAN